MKAALKRILPERQWRQLSTAKRKCISFFETLFVAMIRRLPDRLLIAMKSNSEIVRRMDCQRYEILLDIDSEIEYETRLNSCKKEPETVEWIETFFKEDDVFYDGVRTSAFIPWSQRSSLGEGSRYTLSSPVLALSQNSVGIF